MKLSASLRGGGFICISHGFDYCSLGPEARSQLVFVLMQWLKTQRVIFLIELSWPLSCGGDAKAKQVQCCLKTTNSCRHVAEDVLFLISVRNYVLRLAMWDIVPNTSLLISCRSSKFPSSVLWLESVNTVCSFAKDQWSDSTDGMFPKSGIGIWQIHQGHSHCWWEEMRFLHNQWSHLVTGQGLLIVWDHCPMVSCVFK